MRIKLPIIVLTLLTYDLFSFSSCTFTFLHSPSLFLPRTHARVHTLFLLLSDSVPLCAVDAQIDTEQKIVEHGVRNLCTRITNGSRVESGTGRAAALSSLPVQTRRKPRAAKKKMARAVAPRTTQQYERVFFFSSLCTNLRVRAKLSPTRCRCFSFFLFFSVSSSSFSFSLSPSVLSAYSLLLYLSFVVLRLVRGNSGPYTRSCTHTFTRNELASPLYGSMLYSLCTRMYVILLDGELGPLKETAIVPRIV